MQTEDLDELRRKINDIDEQFCQLIQQRKQVSEAIGIYKKKYQLKIRDEKRESDHIQNLQNKNLSLNKVLIAEVIQKIIDDSVLQQEQI